MHPHVQHQHVQYEHAQHEHEEEFENCMMECASDSTCLGHEERANDALIHSMRVHGQLRPKEFTEEEWEKHVDNLEASEKKGIEKTRRKIKARVAEARMRYYMKKE